MNSSGKKGETSVETSLDGGGSRRSVTHVFVHVMKSLSVYKATSCGYNIVLKESTRKSNVQPNVNLKGVITIVYNVNYRGYNRIHSTDLILSARLREYFAANWSRVEEEYASLSSKTAYSTGLKKVLKTTVNDTATY